MKTAILILHYKNKEDTLKCLESVNKLQGHFPIKIILINNDKNWNLKNRDLEIINNKENLGFAKGINIGIRYALKDKDVGYILILNNDTVVPKNLLAVLLKEKPDIVSPVIKFKSIDDRWVYDYGGKIDMWTGRTTHIESEILNNKLGRDIDYVSGCCMLVKKEVFEKIGLFDERFFFYFEDADFCLRAKKEGFKITVNTSVCVFHKLGGSIGRWSKKAILYNLKNNFLFINKNLEWRKITGFFYLLILSAKIFINYVLGR
jgi:GT2 family glycosyltransferase